MNRAKLIEGGKKHPVSPFLVDLYKRIRSEALRVRIRMCILMLERGPLFSLTIRTILSEVHRLDIGLFSNWPCGEKPSVFHPGTSVGRFTSIARTVRTFTRNHPTNTKSSHGFFENPELGVAKVDLMKFNKLRIGNGVSIGDYAIILPPTTSIGDGAVVYPGSVVCFDVPPYSIVKGFPASVVGYRFGKEKIKELIASHWWEESWSSLAAKECKPPSANQTIECSSTVKYDQTSRGTPQL